MSPDAAVQRILVPFDVYPTAPSGVQNAPGCTPCCVEAVRVGRGVGVRVIGRGVGFGAAGSRVVDAAPGVPAGAGVLVAVAAWRGVGVGAAGVVTGVPGSAAGSAAAVLAVSLREWPVRAPTVADPPTQRAMAARADSSALRGVDLRRRAGGWPGSGGSGVVTGPAWGPFPATSTGRSVPHRVIVAASGPRDRAPAVRHGDVVARRRRSVATASVSVSMSYAP
jgi:hypothetical protein